MAWITFRRLLAGLLGRARAIKQAHGVGIEVAQLLGLELISQNAEQQMPGQVRGRLPPENSLPSLAKLGDAKIAQPRNLGIECLAVRRGRTDPDARHGRSGGLAF
jgi:hypothetical protein